MEGWVTFWTIVLYSGVSLFAVMSVWVIFAGYGDIKRMFAELAAQRDSAAESSRESEASRESGASRDSNSDRDLP